MIGVTYKIVFFSQLLDHSLVFSRNKEPLLLKKNKKKTQSIIEKRALRLAIGGVEIMKISLLPCLSSFLNAAYNFILKKVY